MLNVKLNKQQKGQGMAEYLIMVGVIAIGALGVFGLLGDIVETNVAGVSAELSGGDGSTQIAEGQAAAGNAQTLATEAGQNTLGNYGEQNQYE